VQAPMLFVQGEKDAFGTPDELAPVLAGLSARVYVVTGGDHSFKVPKRGGATQAEVAARLLDEVAAFAMERARAASP
jgi:predicted alpha/beta-hydrolase family hydrolase